MINRIARISDNMSKMIEEEQRRFEREFGIKLSTIQITEMLAKKFGNSPLRDVNIVKWKKHGRNISIM
jgi:hypothetical protein